MGISAKHYRTEKNWLRYPTGIPVETALKRPSMKEIIRAVTLYTGVTLAEIVCRRKNKEIIRARQIAMYLCIQMTPNSFPAVGQIFERDHTTVLHAHRKISYALKYPDKGTDEMLQDDIDLLRSMIEDMVEARAELVVMEGSQ